MAGSQVAEATADRSNVRVSQVGEQRLPAVLEPAVPGLPLASWCAQNRLWLDELILEHGAVLFRGFDLPTPRAFEEVARMVCGDLYGEYGDLPRNLAGERIYHSTPYPADQMILWHNESSHLSRWPMRINFFCVTPAEKGGCTPVVDTRALMHELAPDVIDAFRSKGLLYVRNFMAGIEPTWEQFFHTEDREQVERLCREAGSEAEWRGDGHLRVRQRAQGVARHPKTGEEVFFNQVQLHHVACLDEETREGLRALFDEDDLPRTVWYGDGSPIPDDVIAHILEVYHRTCVRFTWQRGDMITIDNMLAAHARDTYEGSRQIAVAMGQIVGSDQQG